MIDDDPDVLEAIRLSLEAVGHRVVAGPSLEAILPRVQEQERSPDVVVADYRLAGGRTGTEAIRHLHAEFGQPLLSILLTGDTSPVRLQETKRSGYLLLHKPIKFDGLAAAIDQALSRRP